MVEVSINKYARHYKTNEKYIMATVTPVEALAIIISLSNQLLKSSPNASRAEQTCIIDGDIKAGGFFSISVMSMEERAAVKKMLEEHDTKG